MRTLAALLLLLCSCGTIRLTTVGGLADLGSDVYPVDRHTVIGTEVSQVPEEGGLGYEVGARYGEDSGADGGVSVKAESFEAYAGPRYEWHLDRFAPYLSAGLDYFQMWARPSGLPSDHDSDIGYYGCVGVDVDLAEGWFLGLAIRKTVDLDGVYYGAAGDVDAWQYLLRFGFSF